MAVTDFSAVPPTEGPAFDLLDPDLYVRGVPMDEFARLRRTAPVTWFRTPFHEMGFDDDGYWVVTRHADVLDVSKRPEFSTEENTAIPRFGPDMEREKIELQRFVLLNQDPPKHSATRRIVSRGFTPKAIATLKDALADRAERIVHRAVKEGSGDFVQDVAVELPLQAIAELIGVPQEDRHKIFTWSNQMIGYDDAEFTAEVSPEQASAEMLGYAWQLAGERKACPMPDIATTLLNAQIDGTALDEQEFSFFVLLLAVAGNETTRNAISHGMNAFFDHPDQWDLFRSQRPRTAPDEIVRWASPIIAFQRTALSDTQVGGVDVAQGQRVVLFYSSANRDEEVFTDPNTFDITRSPNPHVGFGGTGTHYCLGANLARLEIDLIFNAIADHMPAVRKLSEPRRLRSGWINGLKELPVAYS
ncbi:cytochrome P450 [Spongisporangium articulatum]|uniref:Cytochrome P450 n=1 Tax=Spongisporangium articulatum TaxID=3362603 RepID=A0ABW8ATR6_9ACTN